VITIVENYISLGYKPVPLTKTTKTPFVKAYLTTDVKALWTDYDCNVGLQCGVNGLICFDADNDHTYNQLNIILAPYNPWLVKTRTGTHFWLRTDVKSWGKAYRVMQDDYKGEIRLENCQTVVPPSYVTAANYSDPSKGDWQYKTISGSIATMGYIPSTTVALIIDVTCQKSKLVTPKIVIDVDPTDTPNPLMVKLPHIEWTKVKLLVEKVNWLRTADKGASLTVGRQHYQSRSEVFQSIITTLVRYGYSEADITKIVIAEDIAYQVEPYYAIGLAIHKAYRYLAKSKTVQTLQALYFATHNWRYITDKVVYQYLIARCIQFDTYKIKYSKRGIMMYTGVKDYRTVRRSLDRLVKLELIIISGGLVTVKTVPQLLVSKEELCLLTRDPGTVDIADLHIDLIAERLLGQATKILNVLHQENTALDVKTLHLLTDIPKRSIHRYLTKLNGLGLILVDDRHYTLATDWLYTLYELADDSFNTNYLKIQAEYQRWLTIKNNQKIYGTLKDALGHAAALTLIKRYEDENYVDDIIVTAIHNAGVPKPQFVLDWLSTKVRLQNDL